MTALPIAAVLALAGACQSAVDPATIAKIAQHESGREPFALHDNTTGRSYFPQAKPDAFRLAAALIAAGHSVDVGLSQINKANFSWLGLSLATALDPCTNLRASATVLVGYSKYNTGSPMRGIANGYAAAVQAVRLNLADAGPPPAPDAPPPPPSPPPPLRDALHSPDPGGLIDLLAGHHPRKPAPAAQQDKDKETHEDAH